MSSGAPSGAVPEARGGMTWATWNARALSHSNLETRGAKVGFVRRLAAKTAIVVLHETKAKDYGLRHILRSVEVSHCILSSGDSDSVGGVGSAFSSIDRVWVLLPRSLLAVSRPRAGVTAQPEWVLASGLSDHSPVAVEWPRRCDLPLECRPVPREVAEDEATTEVLSKLGESAHLQSVPMFLDNVCRWRVHKRLLREASRAVRDKKLLAGPRRMRQAATSFGCSP